MFWPQLVSAASVAECVRLIDRASSSWLPECRVGGDEGRVAAERAVDMSERVALHHDRNHGERDVTRRAGLPNFDDLRRIRNNRIGSI